jgi:hypothetical protein
MCDYSLADVASRPAKLADKLVTQEFGTGTRGFADRAAPNVAVCILPGTEIAFPDGLPVTYGRFWCWNRRRVRYHTAIFRQINKDRLDMHHDALEFPDGHVMLLTHVGGGLKATVLQLPARPQNPSEERAQKRVAYAG